MEADDDSPPTGSAHPHSSANAPSGRLASFLRRFRPKNETDELTQPPVRPGLHPRMLFARLASLVPRSPPENDASNELQQPSAPSRLDPHALLARLSSLFPRSRLNTDEETDRHPTTPVASYQDAIINVLSSVFRSQISYQQRNRTLATRNACSCCRSGPNAGQGGIVCCSAATTYSAQWYCYTRCKTCVSITRSISGLSRAFSVLCVSSTCRRQYRIDTAAL